MKIRSYIRLTTSISLLSVFLFLLGCSDGVKLEPSDLTTLNHVHANGHSIETEIGDDIYRFPIISLDVFYAKLNSGELTLSSQTNTVLQNLPKTAGVPYLTEAPTPIPPLSTALVFGMPVKLLDQPFHFGTVITKVSDQDSTDLGNLKLSEIPPLRVKMASRLVEGKIVSISLFNCISDCDKPDQKPVLELPVLGTDSKKSVLYVDLSALGKELDLTIFYQGESTIEKYQSKSSTTIGFDFSKSTLVFDVETLLVQKSQDHTNEPQKDLKITNRWYIKLEKQTNPNFTTRHPVAEVGFFTTDRSPEPLIQRWDLEQPNHWNGIKYYLKNVPNEFQSSFASAFQEWNKKLFPLFGKNVFSFEFVNKDDPRNELLIPGDVRFNILEWDLINKASYGGLGPSIANQFTGQILQATVLIQGPTIIDLYTKWFEASDSYNRLLAVGRENEARELWLVFNDRVQQQVSAMQKSSLALRLGTQLNFTITSQKSILNDPILSKTGFDIIPLGTSFKSYMSGYFHDMVAHELGHNLGLRHNFKGNLGALKGAPTRGGVSRSVMEYLGRGFRYLDRIGEYDLMAISFGYKGEAPQHSDWFCTDEDSADLNDPTKSAECTPDDATDDPFSYYESRLERAINLLISKGKVTAPEWTVTNMSKEITATITGLGVYASSALATGNSWTNFFGKLDRPSDKSQVKDYVLTKLKYHLCNPLIESEILGKATPDAKDKSTKNIVELRNETSRLLQSVFKPSDLLCSTSLD